MENKISDLQAGMTIDRLSQQIVQVQDVMQVQAAHAVNLSLTARNWLIGHYIVEYEQHGEDRAQYGNALLKALAKKLNRRGLVNADYMNFAYCTPYIHNYEMKSLILFSVCVT